uniref:Uncharacterized protein n=1 Tax=Anguilla anguilla TaxID=7936 RepID=A0A0E9SWG9_ANGAN
MIMMANVPKHILNRVLHKRLEILQSVPRLRVCQLHLRKD